MLNTNNYKDGNPQLPFGSLMPDMGQYGSEGALVVSNCLPYGTKYKPMPSLASISAALGAYCKGAFSYRDAAGNVTIFAGTQTDLFKLNGTAWTNVTRLSGGSYTAGVDNFWRFVPFGNLIIATNYTDDIQVFDISTDSKFSKLSSTAPKCRDMAVIANFLVCIDVVDGDGAIGYRVRWSPIANPQGVWGSVPATQTDFQDIFDTVYSNSFITDFGDYGVIVQGRSMYRMDYVGGADIFTFTKLDKGRGTLLTRANVYNGQSIFLRCEDGFYEFTGTQMVPIGDKLIDQFFLDNFNDAYDYNSTCMVDPVRKLVMWSVPHNDAIGGLPNKIYVFNWVSRNWSIIDQQCELLFSYISIGYTLEGLDAVSTNLDLLPFSLDSRAWEGGKTVLAAFDSTHKLNLFTGAPMTAVIQTGEARINSYGNGLVSNLSVYIEGGTTSVRLGYRTSLSSPVTWTMATSANPYTGDFDFDIDSTYFRAEVTISGNWTIADGLGLQISESSTA